MASRSARAPQPDKRKGRTATVRPLQNFHSISTTTDTASLLRLQRLFAAGITGPRANVIAGMAWEAGA